MGWTDHYRRRDALDAVLDRARNAPGGPLPFAGVPGVEDVFDDPAQVLAALQHRWTMKLVGRIEVARCETGHEPGADPVEAVSRAWRRTAAEFPALRGVIDAGTATHAAALRPGIEAEWRLLALTAELAEPHEPHAEITQVGAAFLALVRSAPAPRRTRREPIAHRLRRLVASA